VKTAPHFGHLTFASFDGVAHPKGKTAKIANVKKILTHFLITIHLLSSMYINVCYSKNNASKRRCRLTINKNCLSCQEKKWSIFLDRLLSSLYIQPIPKQVFITITYHCYMPRLIYLINAGVSLVLTILIIKPSCTMTKETLEYSIRDLPQTCP
jgi:hypothetical protein